MIEPAKPFFVQALDALKRGERREAAALLDQQLRFGNTSAKNLPSVAQLAEHIGEIGLAIEAARLAVLPGSIDSLLDYLGRLATFGRSEQALAELDRQPAPVRDSAAALHFRANVATQLGRLAEAEDLFRRALAKAPEAMDTWFSLAMIKTFVPGDPDIAAMERLGRTGGASVEARSRLMYALGKAADDCGDIDRAFGYYAEGAALRRQQSPFSVQGFRAAAEAVIADFTPRNLVKLMPTAFEGHRSLFVTGLPRSGTTLTEQILLNHSAVSDGAELNLMPAALIPTLGVGLPKALAYQVRSAQADPWGEVGRDYASLVDLRFAKEGLVIDKSLGQSLWTGLMLHSLPTARIAWLRRSPEDVALSCFRTNFATGLPWTNSLEDIAGYMQAEDRLFEHWRTLFPDRILTVPYEELVASPAAWAAKLQQHFGLPLEAGLETAPRGRGAVGTASVAQVRQPITRARIGQAAAYERHLKPFRDRYYS